jgi:long-chain fatty acid transport protein
MGPSIGPAFNKPETYMQKPLLALAASTAILGASTNAAAVGFALEHQSVSNLGYAFAGGTANAEDASTIYWNPAGMTRLPGRQGALGVNAIYGSARFTNQGTTSPAGPAFPITGGEGGNPVGLNWVPNLYYAPDAAPRLKAGIGINSPFGLKTKYPSDWMGRYHALDSEVKSLNINPALAWKASERVSLAGGLNLQYFDATRSNAIDYGTACFAAFGPAACAGAGIAPQTRDGIAKVRGDSWGLGWNVGALFEMSPALRMGIAYRSSIEHKITGRATFQNPDLPGAFAALTAAAQDTGARATLKTPDMLSVSLYGEISEKWSLLGDLTWTGWSKFKDLRVRFDNGLPDAVTQENWRDTVRLSLGARYRMDDRWKLRGGIGYEKSAIPDEFRTPRLPDAAHTLVALGFNYEISEAGSLDFGYMHAFVKDAPVGISTPTAGTIVGNYKVRADVLSIQYNHSF